MKKLKVYFWVCSLAIICLLFVIYYQFAGFTWTGISLLMIGAFAVITTATMEYSDKEDTYKTLEAEMV